MASLFVIIDFCSFKISIILAMYVKSSSLQIKNTIIPMRYCSFAFHFFKLAYLGYLKLLLATLKNLTSKPMKKGCRRRTSSATAKTIEYIRFFCQKARIITLINFGVVLFILALWSSFFQYLKWNVEWKWNV